MLHGAQCVEHINSIRPNKTCGNKSKGDVWKTQDTGCRNKLRQSSIRLQRILLPDMLLMEAQMGTHRWIENAYVSMLASHLFIHIDVNDIAQQRNWAGRIYLESSTSRWSPIRGARKKMDRTHKFQPHCTVQCKRAVWNKGLCRADAVL
jgi:hypothetical protein